MNRKTGIDENAITFLGAKDEDEDSPDSFKSDSSFEYSDDSVRGSVKVENTSPIYIQAVKKEKAREIRKELKACNHVHGFKHLMKK